MAHRTPKRQRAQDDASDPDDDAPGPVSSPSPSPSAPRKHTGTACTICRRGHHKCDGKTPICGPCRTHRRECSYSLAADRRRRPGAAEQQQANEKIRALEAEIERLRELLRENNIVDTRRAPDLTITVPEADFGGSGGAGRAFRGASPLTSASSDSSFPWSMPGSPSPWSGSSSLPSPIPPPSGQFLDVPVAVGPHGRSVGGGYSTDEDLPRDGHMGLPLPDVYGKGLIDMQEGPQLPAWMGTTGIPPSPVGVTALTMNFSAMEFNAPERRADIGLAYANSGPGLIAPGVVQGYGMPAGSFDVDTSMLFTGTSMDAAFRNEE